MSGNSNVPGSQASVLQASASPSPVSQAAGDSRLRWAALDSTHERLVTASDSVLADLGRKETPEELLAS